MLLIVLVFALAALLRFINLDRHSLWLDEAATWWNATRGSWLASAFAEANHAPGWWLVTRVFVRAFGDNEFIIRLPAVVAGIACVPLVWLLARRLLDPERVPDAAGFRGVDAGAAGSIALLASIHPLWIEYSQEARMYAALLAGSLGLSLLYLDWLRTRRTRSLVLYALVGAITLYFHHLAALTMIAHACFALWEGLRRRRLVSFVFPLAIAQACALALFLPWLLRTLQSGVSAATLGGFGRVERLGFALWRLAFGPSLATLDRPRIDAGPIVLLREEAGIVIAGGAVVALSIPFALRTLGRDSSARRFLLASVIAPIAALLLAFSWVPLLHEKFLIMVAPYVLLLLVLGARNAPGLLRHFLLTGVFGLGVLGTFAYFMPDSPIVSRLAVHGHPYGKEDWRGARSWIAERAHRGDIVFLYPPYLKLPWDYYDRERTKTVPLPRRPVSLEELTLSAPGWQAASRTFLVTAGIRANERKGLVQDLSTWTARFGSGRPTGLIESKLLTPHWGVWVYEFEGPEADSPRSTR
ncbi:MAG TPA: glycosyltransferase family 39 protein [Candidatus Limnocylindria bacterium]|nr:glycosyltransferase family 39 protein [Candidatus Limnocylindria bacterium]